SGNDEVLLAHAGGVEALRIGVLSMHPVISSSPTPQGLPDCAILATDGRVVVASGDNYTDAASDLVTGKLKYSRQHAALQIFDLAVQHGRLVVLGRPLLLRGSDYGFLYVGRVGDKWESFQLFHAVSAEAEKVLRYSAPPYSGGLALEDDGTIDFITPAEAGVVRYRWDGSPLPTLGEQALRSLVVSRMEEVWYRYSQDVMGRYSEILNRQPTADDLVVTPRGVAVVVRQAHDQRVWWELWFPDAKGIKRKVRLGIDERSPAGSHLRCSARQERLACVYGKFTKYLQPSIPHLVLFDLSQAKPDPACH
ncbi:MAG: hypothetical protein JWN02_56, partial [Acidobacteria bacterium]|nr:hypothetical protein [Acidobacteriota bacterium]